MPSFDVVSEVDMQEVRNAVDQAEPRDRDPLRLQGHRQLDRAEGQDDRARTPRARSASRPLTPGARGEAGQAQGVAEGARLRQGRGGVEGHASARPSRSTSASPTDKAREIGKFIKGLGLKGVPAPGPGRPAPGHRQEARRPAGRDRGDARARLRRPARSSPTSATDVRARRSQTRAAVRSAPARWTCWHARARCASSVGGWVREQVGEVAPCCPVSGLMMYAVACGGVDVHRDLLGVGLDLLERTGERLAVAEQVARR